MNQSANFPGKCSFSTDKLLTETMTESFIVCLCKNVCHLKKRILHFVLTYLKKMFSLTFCVLLFNQSAATTKSQQRLSYTLPSHLIYPLTTKVVGAPQMILQPVSSIFPCSPLPSGTAELQACPFPDVVFPPLPLSALSSSPFHCALQDGFGQT